MLLRIGDRVVNTSLIGLVWLGDARLISFTMNPGHSEFFVVRDSPEGRAVLWWLTTTDGSIWFDNADVIADLVVEHQKRTLVGKAVAAL